MQSYPFYLVNVFAQSHFGGNPLAVFPKADNLTDEQMQAIAKQFNLSETVFLCLPTDKHGQQAAADLRIFTPSYEMPLAGHPTLGSAFILNHLYDMGNEFLVNTNAKPIHIFIKDGRVQLKLSGYHIAQSCANKTLLAKFSGLMADDIKDKAYFVNSGTSQILIQLNSLTALQNIQVNLNELCIFNDTNPLKNPSEPSVYYWVDKGEVIHSRMFFEQNGSVVEDSGTGSACANLGAYLISQNKTPITKTIHQGDDMGRPNRLSLDVNQNQEIFVGGQVVMVGQGEFYLP